MYITAAYRTAWQLNQESRYDRGVLFRWEDKNST